MLRNFLFGFVLMAGLLFLFSTTLGAAPPSELGVEVRPSSLLAGTREAGQSVVYFVLWDWLHEEGQLIEERAERALWNDPSQAPFAATLQWHGSVYGGAVRTGVQLALVEKVGNSARMTGPWEFAGWEPFRIGVDDQPLVAEMTDSRVAVAKQVSVKITGAIDTLSEAWAVAFGRAPTVHEWQTYADAKGLGVSAAGFPVVRAGQVLVFDVPASIHK